jgi:ribosomal protein L40E
MMLLDGWKRPDVIRVYAHLSMRDVESKDLTLHGLKRREEVLRPLMEIRVCQKCKHENAPIAVYCQQCGSILQTLSTEEDRAHLRELEERIAKLEAVRTERVTLEKE